uniref:RNA-directed DNA polymerase n=1 Tax=Macrostomum lignano TaxID=282301 RepID=A0A1I8FP08_9PLAT
EALLSGGRSGPASGTCPLYPLRTPLKTRASPAPLLVLGRPARPLPGRLRCLPAVHAGRRRLLRHLRHWQAAPTALCRVAACLGEAAPCPRPDACEVGEAARPDRPAGPSALPDLRRLPSRGGPGGTLTRLSQHHHPRAALRQPAVPAVGGLEGSGRAGLGPTSPPPPPPPGSPLRGLAAFLTHPLDVAKTRIMLASSPRPPGLRQRAGRPVRGALGARPAGPVRRGGAANGHDCHRGAVFLGVYDTVRLLLSRLAS